ncbi:hypothetical protein ACK15D_18055, partial [Dickeya dianthicola]|uniref:hypothetical protein n=1 Tax=Dickeya dianthicola TaxID=204039 RepID=UPI00398FD9F7
PHKNRRVGAPICSLGRQIFCGSPRPAKAAWARLFAGEARCLKYFRVVIRENISVRCLIFMARYCFVP